MKYKFFKVGGRVCCQGNDEDWENFCPSCKVKVGEQEKAIRQANAKRNQMLQRQREEQARIDASRGNPGKGNEMRIGQGQGQQTTSSAPATTGAGCRCAKCGGLKPSPARAAIIARLSALPAYAGWRLSEMSDSQLAELERMSATSAPAPAPVARVAAAPPAPAPAPAPVASAARAPLRELPDTWNLKATKARLEEEARAAKETDPQERVRASVKAAQEEWEQRDRKLRERNAANNKAASNRKPWNPWGLGKK